MLVVIAVSFALHSQFGFLAQWKLSSSNGYESIPIARWSVEWPTQSLRWQAKFNQTNYRGKGPNRVATCGTTDNETIRSGLERVDPRSERLGERTTFVFNFNSLHPTARLQLNKFGQGPTELPSLPCSIS
jgi:hypothetical protein